MANIFRRKQYVVEKKLQYRYAKQVLLLVLVTSVLTGLTIFYTTFLMLGERLADVYPQGRLVEIFRSVHIAFFVNMIVILPFIFWGAIMLSHRIAGPLPKIYNTLREIGKGNFDVRVQLRKNDELTDLADAINEAATNLKAKQNK